MSAPTRAPLNIDAFLAGEGFTTPDARAEARAAIEAAGLTRPGKQNIAADKLPRVRATLAQFVCVCVHPPCGQLAASWWPGRRAVVVLPANCAVCGGSSQRRAVRHMARALEDCGWLRLLVIGGTSVQHQELRFGLQHTRVVARLVDGSGRAHTSTEARPHVLWAQLLVVWSSTPMHHKASIPYTSQAPARLPVVITTKPGLEALCRTVIAVTEQGRL